MIESLSWEKILPNCGNVLLGRVVDATYNSSEEPTEMHHPFIEALPRLFSYEKSASLISCYPFYHETDRTKSIEYRTNAVERIKTLMVPLPQTIDLERKLSRSLRNGYKARNPIPAAYVRQLRAGFPKLDWESGDKQYIPLLPHAATGFALVGVSGSGKTFTLQRILNLYPQVINHKEYCGQEFIRKQLVWMLMDCPPDGSIRGLIIQFFELFDLLMGTRCSEKIVRLTVDQLVPQIAKLTWLHGLGVLVIDEIQRLCNVKGIGNKQMLAFLVYLVNTVGVPVILSGTYKAIKLLSTEFAEARRAAGQGDIVWANFSADSEEWNTIAEGIWSYQLTNTPTNLTPKHNKALYLESQGIPDIAAKIYMLSQCEIIGTGNEVIHPSLFKIVSKKHLNFARPILDALRTKDYEKLKTIDDIYPGLESFDEMIKRAKDHLTIEGSLSTLRNVRKNQMAQKGSLDYFVTYVAKMLTEAGGYELKVALECAQKALERHATETDLKKAIPEAFCLAAQYEQVRDKKSCIHPTKSKPDPLSMSGDMRMIIKDVPDSEVNYAALKAAGYIQGPDQISLSDEPCL